MSNSRSVLSYLLAIASLMAFPLVRAPQDMPPGHPALPQAPTKVPTPEPADVSSPEAIVGAYYSTISGPVGEPRNWDRFRSLFFPDGRFVTTRAHGERSIPFVLSPEDFISSNKAYFENGGYFETEVHRSVDQFGAIAHVFSTYESRRTSDGEPYSRGINSFQLLNTGERWWIISVSWDYERPEGPAIPAKYLGDQNTGG